MSSGDERDAGLAIPEECVRWCRAQDYQVMVGDDMARVDLDWWNRRLERYAIPARIVGRDTDGAPTDHGVGYLRRADLDGDNSPAHRWTDLTVLYRAAAWLSGHPERDRRRRFLDVRAPSPPGREFDVITTVLAACRSSLLSSVSEANPDRRWSGWPRTPGVGPALLSLYCWATHHPTDDDTNTNEHGSAVHEVVRPQLLDQQTVASLIHLGWLEHPAVAGFTWTRYTRYCHLLHTWAAHTGISAELIEMWFAARWRERLAGQRSAHAQWHQ